VLLAVLALALPMAAFASSSVDFSNSGGTLTGTNAGMTLTGSTLIAVNGLNGGGLVTGNLGTVEFSTGALTSGDLHRLRLEAHRLASDDLGAASREPIAQPVDDDRSLLGTETVLLVEDEEALRSIGKEILEAYGYTVIVAGDGVEALEIVRGGSEPIHLVMTDVLMPRMGGIELAEELSKLHPGLKILYTSGYNDSGTGLSRVTGSRYLQKPYAMQELARALRDLLDPA